MNIANIQKILEIEAKQTNIYPLINDNYYNLRVENEYK